MVSDRPWSEGVVREMGIGAAVGSTGVGLAVIADKGMDAYRTAKIVAAAKRADSAHTVLGNYPAYVKLADAINAKRFNIPTAVWNKMDDAQKWGANQKFLDRMIARGDDIVLATPVNKVKPGSYYEKELRYLMEKGYRLSEDGTRLVR